MPNIQLNADDSEHRDESAAAREAELRPLLEDLATDVQRALVDGFESNLDHPTDDNRPIAHLKASVNALIEAARLSRIERDAKTEALNLLNEELQRRIQEREQA